MLRRLLRNWWRIVATICVLGGYWPLWRGWELDHLWDAREDALRQRWAANAVLARAEADVYHRAVTQRAKLESALRLMEIQTDQVKLRSEEVESSRQLFNDRGDCYLHGLLLWGVGFNLLWLGPHLNRAGHGWTRGIVRMVRGRGTRSATGHANEHGAAGAQQAAEAEWLHGSDPEPMLEDAHLASERKLRLFAAACCRRVWEQLGADARRAVEVAERHADGTAAGEELDAARPAAGEPSDREAALVRSVTDRSVDAGDCASAAATFHADSQTPRQDTPSEQEQWYEAVSTESTAQADLLRCVFGNPFRPVVFDADWRTSTVVGIANQMYESGDFSSAPVLADAIQDAGCTSADVLDHLRHGGQHARGCWVVDLVLGKE
jgi:hypothetical protein